MFVLLLALLWPVSLAKVAVNDFFPFGVSNGDTVMIRSDDGSSPSIPISIGFPFFDYLHDSLWVNVNGAISFLTTISTFTPVCTPVQQNFRMIAPYWCDIDISRTGDIFYRESFDASVLGKATDEVSSAFPDSRHIRLRWAFIITWFNVTFFPDTFDQRPRNTFQAVLTTDGTQSFAIFYYNNMTWTTGQATSSGGNSSGLGGIPAKAGFDAGDGQTLFMIPGSCTSDIVTIGDRSNVGSPGKWLFRVDNSNVQSAGCSNNFTGNVRVSPSFVNAYGHVPIEITGPCVQAAENATCRFYDPSGNVTDAPAVIMGNQTSMKFGCSTPFFYTIGRLRLDLIISINDTQQQLFTGFLYITMPSDSDAGLQVSVQPSPNRTDYYRMTFNWNPADFAPLHAGYCAPAGIYLIRVRHRASHHVHELRKRLTLTAG
uniref:NIDO domain-containing protein n=1 Tax=Plectus sambesii TaxID=2011161 RepID=A0A914VSW5_9BILA